MGLQPFLTTYPWSEEFSEVIDVRSPAEFAQDHIPEAINLPVLDNEQRAEIGTLYKQFSPFVARKRGAALVSRNISAHLSAHFADKPKDYRPVIYCWRGGQRSLSLATVLSQVGWRTGILNGGYKIYRSHVRQQLDVRPAAFHFKVLCGLTGTAKTTILRRLMRSDHQVLDLESLANHRGSLLGRAVNSPQPSQKRFESTLLTALERLDPQHLVWVEAESNKIGQVFIPPSLWNQLKQGCCIEILAPMESRVTYLATTYPHFSENLAALGEQLQHLKSRYGNAQIAQWHQLIDQGDVATIVRSLLEVHYDPAYRRSMRQQYLNQAHQIHLPDLSSQSLDGAIEQLITLSHSNL